MTINPMDDAAPRPKSTLAQIVTASAATLTALLLVVSAVVGVKLMDQLGRTTGDISLPSAATQWVCLPYATFVLEQHRAGLTPKQIAAVLEVSEFDRRGQGGVTRPEVRIEEPRLDSIEACGLPFEIIAEAS